jgi:hypothetical protein
VCSVLLGRTRACRACTAAATSCDHIWCPTPCPSRKDMRLQGPHRCTQVTGHRSCAHLGCPVPCPSGKDKSTWYLICSDFVGQCALSFQEGQISVVLNLPNFLGQNALHDTKLAQIFMGQCALSFQEGHTLAGTVQQQADHVIMPGATRLVLPGRTCACKACMAVHRSRAVCHVPIWGALRHVLPGRTNPHGTLFAQTLWVSVRCPSRKDKSACY